MKDYVDCRYVCTCEAVMGYDIHYIDPHVEHLSLHLKGKHSVTFKDGDLIIDLLEKHVVAKKKFLKWI